MNFYISVSPNEQLNLKAINDVCPIKEVNALCSFQYKKAMAGFKPRQCKRFLADSGAFTAMNAGLDIDTKYIDNYIQWIIEDEIDQYIEMDLDEILGTEKTKEIRKYIESSVGKKSIPCFHLERGQNGWIEMCEQYDYVAISLSRMTRVSKWLQKHKFVPLRWFMYEARKRATKVHALGCNDFSLMKQYHFHSSDCSTHTQGSRYGQVLIFKDGRLVNINKNSNRRVKYEEVNKQNIKAVIEGMRYAERML